MTMTHIADTPKAPCGTYVDGGHLVDAATLHLLTLDADDPGERVEIAIRMDEALPERSRRTRVHGNVYQQEFDLGMLGMPGAGIQGCNLWLPGDLPDTIRATIAGRPLGALVAAPDFLADRIIASMDPPLPSLKGIPGHIDMISLHLEPVLVALPPRRT